MQPVGVAARTLFLTVLTAIILVAFIIFSFPPEGLSISEATYRRLISTAAPDNRDPPSEQLLVLEDSAHSVRINYKDLSNCETVCAGLYLNELLIAAAINTRCLLGTMQCTEAEAAVDRVCIYSQLILWKGKLHYITQGGFLLLLNRQPQGHPYYVV